jgi:chaperonin GroES
MKKSKKSKQSKGKVTKKSASKSRRSKVGIPTKASGQKNMVGMTPLGDRVLVKPEVQETTTAFGIIIPDTAKEKPETGVVVAVGPGKKSDAGATLPMSVSPGDRVMFSKYGFDEIKLAGQEYYLISEANILAILD